MMSDRELMTTSRRECFKSRFKLFNCYASVIQPLGRRGRSRRRTGAAEVSGLLAPVWGRNSIIARLILCNIDIARQIWACVNLLAALTESAAISLIHF